MAYSLHKDKDNSTKVNTVYGQMFTVKKNKDIYKAFFVKGTKNCFTIGLCLDS